MRSETAKRIMDETPQEIKKKAKEYGDKLVLYEVVGRSEQLPCGDCENYAEWDNGIRWCSVCGTKLS